MATSPRTEFAQQSPTLDLRNAASRDSSRHSSPDHAAEVDLDFDTLHDRWSAASRARLGLSRQQWYDPATNRLVAAIADGEDLTDALHDLGAARAAAGLSLDEVLADLAVLGSLTAHRDADADADLGIDRVDHLRAASVAATAWTEAFYASVTAPSCVDGLTGLVTASFLEARLDQLAQQRRHGPRADRRYVLVVLALRCENTSPFSVLARRIRAAGELRAAFPTNDTVAVLDPTHALVALVEQGPELDEQVDALAANAPSDRVWVEAVPTGAGDAVALVRELATIPRLPTVASPDTVRHP